MSPFRAPFCILMLLSFIAPSSHGMMCVDIFTLSEKANIPSDPTNDETFNRDPRQELELLLRKDPQALLKVGEGNSAEVYLFQKPDGSYAVAKIYRDKFLDKLERDHQGLQLLQLFFEKNSLHDSHFTVVKSTVVPNFQGKGITALEMPFVDGLNLHSLLVKGSPKDPLVIQARELYSKMIDELYQYTEMRGYRDEIRPETPLYFRDHVVDGMPMLDINGRTRLLIKTDNIIFNPETQTLTIVDPF